MQQAERSPNQSLAGIHALLQWKNIIPTFTWDYNKGDIKYMLKHGKTMLPKGAHIVGQAAGERASSTNLRPIKSARRFRNSFISSVHWVDWRQNLWTKNGIQRERERLRERNQKIHPPMICRQHFQPCAA
jgi:hypothetical protein